MEEVESKDLGKWRSACLDIVFPKLPKTSSLSWNSVRCVVEGKGGYLKGNSLTVSETRAVESKTGKKKFPGIQTVTGGEGGRYKS